MQKELPAEREGAGRSLVFFFNFKFYVLLVVCEGVARAGGGGREAGGSHAEQ